MIAILRVTTFAALFLLFAPASAAQTVDSLLAQGTDQLEQGVTTGSAAMVRDARAMFERATSGDAHTALAHYYVALADYRLIDLVDDEDASEAFGDDAQTRLERAVELRPDWAEAHALLASVYGRKASRGMFSGMRYGPRAQRTMEQATSLAPENPRVLLLDAISLYNTPERWGGNKEKAVTTLRAAIERFEAVPSADPLAPNWGHADAYVWLGKAHMEAGRIDQARAAFEKALALRPGYAWVEQGLLPKVVAAE